MTRELPEASSATGPKNGSEATAKGSGASWTVAAGVLCSRVLGLARDRAIAHLLGVGFGADIVHASFRGPNYLQNLLGDQALSAAFIPIYGRFLSEGREREARRFAGTILALLMVAVAAGVVLGVVAAPWLFAVLFPGWLDQPERRDAMVLAMRILFPMSGILVLAAWCLAVLTTHRRFFLPYFAPALWNLAILAAIATLVLSGRAVDPRSVVVTVAIGALFGAVLQLGVQAGAAARQAGGIELHLSLEAPGVRSALRNFVPVLAARGVVQISGYLDYVLASFLVSGAISALHHSARIYLLALTLVGTAVAVVELPELSRLGGDLQALGARLRSAAVEMWFLAVPSAVGLAVLGYWIVGTLFGSGEFGGDDTLLVAMVLGAYSLGLLGSSTARLLQNLFYALGEPRIPAWTAGLRIVVAGGSGAAAMLWLDRYAVPERWLGAPTELHMGALGLALGSALGAWVELLWLERAARVRLDRPPLPWRRIRLPLAVALGWSPVWWWVAHTLGWPLWVVGIAATGGFAFCYLATCRLAAVPEALRFTQRLRRLTVRRQETNHDAGP